MVGILISILTAVALVFVIAVELQVSRRKLPTFWIQCSSGAVGIRWRTEVHSWSGLERAVQAIDMTLTSRYGAEIVRKKGLLNFWIDVYPKNTRLRTDYSPSGLSGGRVMSGTLDRINLYFGLKRQSVVLVMQRHASRTRLPNGEVWQEGNLLSAQHSAIFHEVAEHYVPLCLTDDLNLNHAEEWKSLTLEIRRQYDLLEAADV